MLKMRGVDISNWQRGLVPSSLNVDFCICKASEGTTYVDNTCDAFVQDCIANGILWGFYHFAGGGNPEDEARFFYNACVNYFGHGIPMLDFEVDARECSNVEFCERFLSTLHDLSGVWAMLYISASRTIDYIGSWVPEKCGLWVAGYPWHMTTWPDDESLPYNINPWSFAAIWQFSSSLRLASYDGDLDGDIAYMDADAWARYAAQDSKPVDDSAKRKSIDKLAREVIAGKWGNGTERENRLGAKYRAVMERVNEYYHVADEVITGKWGNGWNRKIALTGAGWNYNTVQKIVNAKMEGR